MKEIDSKHNDIFSHFNIFIANIIHLFAEMVWNYAFHLISLNGRLCRLSYLWLTANEKTASTKEIIQSCIPGNLSILPSWNTVWGHTAQVSRQIIFWLFFLMKNPKQNSYDPEIILSWIFLCRGNIKNDKPNIAPFSIAMRQCFSSHDWFSIMRSRLTKCEIWQNLKADTKCHVCWSLQPKFSFNFPDAFWHFNCPINIKNCSYIISSSKWIDNFGNNSQIYPLRLWISVNLSNSIEIFNSFLSTFSCFSRK